ncbi:MAG: STM4014 family protein [Acidobacteria bacterium]|nr:STM4014 family protein [Acidobacteriota bacterium]
MIVTSKWVSDVATVPPFHLVVIGNPNGQRIDHLQAALNRLNLPPAQVVPYTDLIAGRVRLPDVMKSDSLLRIESPDKDFETYRAFLKLGSEPAASERSEFLLPEEVDRLQFEKGRLWPSRQWYLGFCKTLRLIEVQVAECLGVQYLQSPLAIARMFDKRLCQSLFSENGIPVPQSLGPTGCFDELLTTMHQIRCHQVFVKLAHGSSAAGAVALRINNGRFQAITTVEMVQERAHLKLYNSRKIRTYTNPKEIAELVNALCRHRVQVERWLPKAASGKGCFDLRMVVIAGRVHHIVARTSRSPFTNLHLLNTRGDLEAIRVRIPDALWHSAVQSCEQAITCFPGSFYAGVDVLITAGYRSHAVLEINAFGDLLPGVLQNGLDTYSTELLPWLNQRSRSG